MRLKPRNCEVCGYVFSRGESPHCPMHVHAADMFALLVELSRNESYLLPTQMDIQIANVVRRIESHKAAARTNVFPDYPLRPS